MLDVLLQATLLILKVLTFVRRDLFICITLINSEEWHVKFISFVSLQILIEYKPI